MSECWSVLKEAVGNNVIDAPSRNQVLGRFQSRVILHLLKKEKDGLEKTSYRGLAQINEQFLEELALATGPIDHDEAKCVIPNQEPAAANASSTDRPFTRQVSFWKNGTIVNTLQSRTVSSIAICTRKGARRSS